MTSWQKDQCHKIIHTTAVSAGATGAGAGLFGPIAALTTDATVLIRLEITMIIRLGKVFDKEISKSVAASVLAAAAATTVGKSAASFLSMFPVVGAFANAAAASGTVEAVGWATAKLFDDNVY